MHLLPRPKATYIFFCYTCHFLIFIVRPNALWTTKNDKQSTQTPRSICNGYFLINYSFRQAFLDYLSAHAEQQSHLLLAYPFSGQ